MENIGLYCENISHMCLLLSSVHNIVSHVFVVILCSSTSVLKILPIKFPSNQNKHDIFQSVINAAHDLPGHILHMYLLNSCRL